MIASFMIIRHVQAVTCRLGLLGRFATGNGGPFAVGSAAGPEPGGKCSRVMTKMCSRRVAQAHRCFPPWCVGSSHHGLPNICTCGVKATGLHQAQNDCRARTPGTACAGLIFFSSCVYTVSLFTLIIPILRRCTRITHHLWLSRLYALDSPLNGISQCRGVYAHK